VSDATAAEFDRLLDQYSSVGQQLIPLARRMAFATVAGVLHGTDVARRVYVAACVTGVAGLLVFAHAPNAASAAAGSLLVSGIGFPTTRVAGTILVNRRTTSDVRATVHSFLSQAENLGEIILGLALAFIAGSASSTVVLTASAALLACAGAVVSHARE
jgi:hypothetical protein